MKRYVVRIESEDNPSSIGEFNPIALEFPEPLSFLELCRLQTLLKERGYERIETAISRALLRMKDEFSIQGQIIDYAVSAKIFV